MSDPPAKEESKSQSGRFTKKTEKETEIRARGRVIERASEREEKLIHSVKKSQSRESGSQGEIGELEREGRERITQKEEPLIAVNPLSIQEFTSARARVQRSRTREGCLTTHARSPAKPRYRPSPPGPAAGPSEPGLSRTGLGR